MSYNFEIELKSEEFEDEEEQKMEIDEYLTSLKGWIEVVGNNER